MLHKLVFDIQPLGPFVENSDGIVAVRTSTDWLRIIQQAELGKDFS